MAYATGLKPVAFGHEGSSPSLSTMKKKSNYLSFEKLYPNFGARGAGDAAVDAAEELDADITLARACVVWLAAYEAYVAKMKNTV